ncbi:hypothetical protein BJX62DRAFT_240546 [Aspergillus germanicus]
MSSLATIFPGICQPRATERVVLVGPENSTPWGAASGSDAFSHGDPAQRSEDVRSAVSFLAILEEVDNTWISVLGICASGEYGPYAAQTDLRIRAVATISAADAGAIASEGFKNTPFELDSATLTKTLEATGANRITEAKGKEVLCDPIVPDLPEGYVKKRGSARQLLRVFFDHLVSPRPLLMIAGGDAHTLYFIEEGIKRAEEPEELYIVPGQSHVALYGHLDEHIPKLVDFMAKSLCN